MKKQIKKIEEVLGEICPSSQPITYLIAAKVKETILNAQIKKIKKSKRQK